MAPIAPETWPPLRLADWSDTYGTLHLWMQTLGKVRLALAPRVNHWWEVPFYLTSRGLTTSPVPYLGASFEMRLDFFDHQLTIEASSGTRRTIALEPQTVAAFYARVMQALRELGINVRIWPMSVEMPSPVRLDRDTAHGSYDPAAVHRWWQVMLQADNVLKEFRARFIGKASPVHFFWGGFDLAATRFSGRRAPERPGADSITREGYSHEVSSTGFWPGGSGVDDAAFYAYASPEPPGFKDAPVRPAAASYHTGLGEFILMYEDVRTAPSPREVLLQFLQSTYEAAANFGKWNRIELER